MFGFMILGIGTDLIDCRRLRRPLTHIRTRFLNRLMTEDERIYLHQKTEGHGACLSSDDALDALCLHVGKVFAAKEAFVKALGTGFRGYLNFLDLNVYRDTLGKPHIQTSARANDVIAERIHTRAFAHIPHDVALHHERCYAHLSLSDEKPYAQAFVTLTLV